MAQLTIIAYWLTSLFALGVAVKSWEHGDAIVFSLTCLLILTLMVRIRIILKEEKSEGTIS